MDSYPFLAISYIAVIIMAEINFFRNRIMRKTYDFSKSARNPYARRLKKRIEVRQASDRPEGTGDGVIALPPRKKNTIPRSGTNV